MVDTQLFDFACLAVVSFCSTDVDDLFVLIAFFADRNFRKSDVFAGQFCGMLVLYGISLLASLGALLVPKVWLGLLGFVPIFLGAWKLLRPRREAETPLSSKPGNILAVFAVTLANGGDNLGVWTPLLAGRPAVEIALAGLVFAALTALWCLAALWLVEHPALKSPLRLYGHRVVPFALIGLGLAILLGSGSVGLFLH